MTSLFFVQILDAIGSCRGSLGTGGGASGSSHSLSLLGSGGYSGVGGETPTSAAVLPKEDEAEEAGVNGDSESASPNHPPPFLPFRGWFK